MRVNNVLVDEVVTTEIGGPAKLRSTLYEFSEAQWVSVHGERGSRRLGPITLLKEHAEDLERIDDFRVTEFPPRPIHADDKAITFRENWTIPPGTVYVIVPPGEFVATRIAAQSGAGVSFEVAANAERGLFYFATFRTPDVPEYQIEARFEYNPSECERIRLSGDLVAGTEHFRGLRSAVATQALSPEFWFNLISFAGKYIK
jgi:hypothetical protein